MDKKAEAYKKYNNAAIIQMLVGILPDVVKNVAAPISSIKEVKVFSGGGADGGGVSSISGQVPVAIRQALDVVKEATGVDMADIIKAGTFDAKTTRNINLGGPLGEQAGDFVENISDKE